MRHLCTALRALLLLAAPAVMAAAAPALAQDTIPVRRDSARIAIPPEAVRADTLPSDTTRPDSLIPAPSFPEFPRARGGGFALAAWTWERRDLSYFQGLSLAELLEGVPGLVITRSGSLGQAAGFSAFASGGGRLRVFLDGWEMRPLEGAAVDLQRIPLADVQRLRVERGLTETRVEVWTFRLPDARPFAQIEGADGDFNTRFLRGFFARPVGSRVVVHAGLDLVETDGFRRRENYGSNTQFAVASYTAGDRGVQLELRRSKFDVSRQVGTTTAFTDNSDRTEVLLRARGRVAGGLWVDGALGRSTYEPASEDTLLPPASSTQAMLRASLDVPLGVLTGAARLHRADDRGFVQDATELSVRADLSPAPWLAAMAEARSLSVAGEGGVETEVAARAGPFGPFSLFGGVATGSRGVLFARDTLVDVLAIGGIAGPPVSPTVQDTLQLFGATGSGLTALRAGADFQRGSVTAGAAFVRHDLDRFVPYGLLFDRGVPPEDGEAASGVEAHASLPLYFRQLRLDAWYAYWLEGKGRPYLPTQQGWASLRFHNVYLGGNFEPTLQLEMAARDYTYGPDPESPTGELIAYTPRYAILNFYVQLRILDVRIFYRLDNVLNRQTASDIPGTNLPGTRALYGLRWFFRN